MLTWHSAKKKSMSSNRLFQTLFQQNARGMFFSVQIEIKLVGMFQLAMLRLLQNVYIFTHHIATDSLRITIQSSECLHIQNLALLCIALLRYVHNIYIHMYVCMDSVQYASIVLNSWIPVCNFQMI